MARQELELGQERQVQVQKLPELKLARQGPWQKLMVQVLRPWLELGLLERPKQEWPEQVRHRGN